MRNFVTCVALGSVVLGGACAVGGDDVDSTAAPLAVTWTNIVGAAATGADLTKTNGTAAWNAGAVSVASLGAAGYVELTVADATTTKAAGLSNGDGSQHVNDIDFALRFTASGNVQVNEGGVVRGAFGGYAAGDRFRIEVGADGTVRYSRSGEAPFYASAVAPTFPLLVDTALYTPGAAIQDVDLVSTALTWQNVIGVAVQGDDLVKTANAVGWTAGASSLPRLAGDGFVAFVAPDATRLKAAGLSSDDASQHYADIDYAIRLTATGVVQVFEGGVSRGNFGTYLPGDHFRVEVSGGVVTYSRDGGAPFYTSTIAPTGPLLVDTAFHTPGARLNDFRIVEAAQACAPYSAAGLVCSGSFVVNNSFDLAEIAQCAHVTGNLTFAAPGMTEIALPRLERIGGDLVAVDNPELARLRLPALKEVGGETRITGAPSTRGIDLSSLYRAAFVRTEVAQSLDLAFPCLDTSGALSAHTIEGTGDGVDRIAVPRLRHVAGDLVADATAPQLADVDGGLLGGDLVAPALTLVTGSVLNSSLDAPNLVEIGGDLSYQAGPRNVPSLVVIGRHLQVGPATNPIDLPSLVEVGSTLSSTATCTAALRVISLPSLERLGALGMCWDSTRIVAPQLQALTRGLSTIGSQTGASTVQFPALTTIEGSFTTYAPCDFPQLTTVERNLNVYASIDAPQLTTIGGNVLLGGALTTGNLVTIGGTLRLATDTAAFPVLATVGGLVVKRDSTMTGALSFPALTQITAGGGSFSGALWVVRADISSLSFPVLASIAGTFLIERNWSLTSIDFPALTSVGSSFGIIRNIALPSCYADDLLAQLQAAGWTGSVSIWGNNGTGSCPP